MQKILEEIIARKRIDVEARRAACPPDGLLSDDDRHVQTRSMSAALAASPTGIIAEFKRRSPSKGWIHQEADVMEIPAAYARAGATVLSVLADTPYFGGSMTDIKKARSRVTVPILCKEFIIDEYQILEARAMGADAILLIAAALDVEQCYHFAQVAHTLGLEVLLELHDESELPYADIPVDMIGVNNRDLNTFHTDTAIALRMATLLPKRPVLVAESGISDPATVARLRAAGYRGFLIGEHFMQSDSPGETLAEFIAALGQYDKGVKQ